MYIYIYIYIIFKCYLVSEITCEVPHDQHVYKPFDYFSGDMKLGAIRSYHCESGYRKTEEKATCTRDGWTPKLLCDVLNRGNL